MRRSRSSKVPGPFQVFTVAKLGPKVTHGGRELKTAGMARKFAIEDIAREAGIIFPQNFETLCRDCDIDDLAELCDPWELIGYHLGLDQAQLSAIKDDYSNTELKRIKMLQKWKESRFKPTYGHLIEAFLKCGKVEQALIVGKRLSQNEVSAASVDATENPSKQYASPHEISPHYQIRRESDIKESLRMLDRKFAGVQRQLMVATGVTLEKLKSCIATFRSFRSGSPAPLLHSVSINEFFHLLKDYCNAQSPDILEDLVEELGDENTKRK